MGLLNGWEHNALVAEHFRLLNQIVSELKGVRDALDRQRVKVAQVATDLATGDVVDVNIVQRDEGPVPVKEQGPDGPA